MRWFGPGSDQQQLSVRQMPGSTDVPGLDNQPEHDHRSWRVGVPLRALIAGTGRQRSVIEDEDRTHAGVLNGALWVGATVSLLPLLFIGSVTMHRTFLFVLAAIGLVIGVASFTVIDWRRVPQWCFVAISLFAVAAMGAVIWGTGGVHSPVSSYLTISILFTAWFYPARIALGFLLLDTLVSAAPVFYDHDTSNVNDWLRVLFSSSVLALVAGGVLVGRALTWLHRDRADRLAIRHRAMRAIASAVVEGVDADSMYRLVAREVLALSDGGWAGILRVNGSGETLTLMGAWPPDVQGVDPAGTTIPLMSDSPIRVALQTRLPAPLGDLSRTRFGQQAGFTSGLVAPVLTQDENAFVITVTAALGRQLRDDREELIVVGEAIAAAIKSLRDRDKLAEQASSDSLTGVSNHRVLTAKLDAEVFEAVERKGSLSVAVMDIDEFKQVNDVAGHEFGDATLIRLAHSLREVADPRDTISRVGGDEFVWLMPGIAADEAFERVECARELFQRVSGDHMVTLSVGISDLTCATLPADLTRLADGALYWCKAHGRAQTRIYDPQAVDDLTESERAEKLAHVQTLVGLRALARAIDAKDPVTSQHSERVADLAARLARANGWSEARIGLLRDAALVHDVGKLAIPDALLSKQGELTDREQLQMSQHVELSVRIATGVLTEEQLEWIGSHHERHDGSGYPHGLYGDQISDGGALISIANAYDAMTSGYWYGRLFSPCEALEECRTRSGSQFAPAALTALECVLDARGRLARLPTHEQVL